MNVAFFSTKSYDRASFDQLLPSYSHQITYFEAKLDHNSAILAHGHEVVCAFVNDQLDKATLKNLKNEGVKLIALRCAGYNQVDLNEAKKLGITLVRVPAYSPEAVAEHALALILTLSRKTHKAYNRVRENNYSIEGLTGFNLYGKTVGVIGTGAIGTAFCKIVLGLGCTVLASDPFENQKLKKLGVSFLPVKDLLKKSDIVSMHCPLTPATKHMINKESLQLMKNGCMLINTSRGALIETKAAIQALKIGKIGYLGIDVYEQEEDLFFQNRSEEILQDEQIARLMTFPNVLVTGHQAFLTHEALYQIAKTTLDNLVAFEHGETLVNEVK
ncbi:2-hydroxyacid dehydrogenase [Algoriphagus sp.]|uniref:2-hydroxyacid dehydrogenase n=1 Tax=Algoriphagus sp. TaxID=1872435 RepID=UPI0026164811|nr:2-hydroxyacid dehydrogenase [Algoriphagus sp.]